LAVEIVKKINEATLKMKNINHQEVLKIGSTQSNTTIRLITFMDRLNNDFEDMKLDFVIDSTLNLIDKLINYKIDIACKAIILEITLYNFHICDIHTR